MVRSLLVSIMAIIMVSGLQAQSTARLQVIHNAADPAAASVDVYLGSSLLLDNFEFRTATPFIDAPADIPITVGIAPGNSTSVSDTITSFTVTLTGGQTYVAIANGILDPSTFSANPDGRATAFTLFLKDNARESGTTGSVDFFAVHGATDAPAVDVIARGGPTLVDNASYGDITGYISVPAASYTLDITPASDNSTAVASFNADLSSLGGGAAVVFASGFLNPVNNQSGELFGLFAALPNGTVVELPVTTARLQVVHNSADPAAGEVDVYLNGQMILNDFAFRTATPFIDVPARLNLNIGVAPGNSSSFSDTLTSFNVSLAENGSYVAFANGVLNPSNFAENPDGRSTAFTLFVRDNARTAAQSSGDFDFAVLHGATDAPTVDVMAQAVPQPLVDNAGYGDVTGYISVAALAYRLNIVGAAGSPRYAAFEASLYSLVDSAAIVFASGFVSPVNNQNGELFGLFAVLPGGTVVELPLIPARVQIIHNAADPAAASVDLYLNGELLVDDFDFRQATPFVDVPGNLPLNIGVAPATSTGFSDTLFTLTGSFRDENTFIVFANGVTDPAQFAPNPDGRSIEFSVFARDSIYENGPAPSQVAFIAFHGATDAPTVDVVARNVGTLIDDISYGDFNSEYYINVPASSYILDITPGNDNSTVVASFIADLSGAGGATAVVFASGFLNPAANENGEAFGLYAALADGQVIAFPQESTARLQVIHNAADAAAAAVDIYLGDTRLLDDFGFREATPFIDAPADQPITIGIAPSTSTSVADTITSFTVTLTGGETYVAIANGVLDPAGFAANPDGRNIGFTLFLEDNIRETAQGSDVDFIVLHGATDAPAVDVIARGVTTLVEDAAYGDITSYITVPPASYILDVTPAGDNSTIVASFNADLSGLGGGSAIVFASGFLAPSDNGNGPEFGIYAALADGQVVSFDMVTGIERETEYLPREFSLEQNYPNPFNPATTIAFSLPEAQFVSLKVFNILGEEVASLMSQELTAGAYRINFDASSLVSGMYFYRIEAGSFSEVRRMMLLK